jgi:hypothetical protein
VSACRVAARRDAPPWYQSDHSLPVRQVEAVFLVPAHFLLVGQMAQDPTDMARASAVATVCCANGAGVRLHNEPQIEAELRWRGEGAGATTPQPGV